VCLPVDPRFFRGQEDCACVLDEVVDVCVVQGVREVKDISDLGIHDLNVSDVEGVCVLLQEEALGVLSLLVFAGVVFVESCETGIGVTMVGLVLFDDKEIGDEGSICCTFRSTSTSLYLLLIAEQNSTMSSKRPSLTSEWDTLSCSHAHVHT